MSRPRSRAGGTAHCPWGGEVGSGVITDGGRGGSSKDCPTRIKKAAGRCPTGRRRAAVATICVEMPFDRPTFASRIMTSYPCFARRVNENSKNTKCALKANELATVHGVVFGFWFEPVAGRPQAHAKRAAHRGGLFLRQKGRTATHPIQKPENNPMHRSQPHGRKRKFVFYEFSLTRRAKQG